MRHIAILAVWCMLSFSASACDVCGCSASGSMLGILPQFKKHFVGLSYQYQTFHTTHPEVLGSSLPGKSDDYFHGATLWGRFYPVNRLQLFAFVPYRYNYVREENSTIKMNGLGDVKLLANYMLINTPDTMDGFRHTLLLGGGVKAPTGPHDFKNAEGIILSNMQPGTGSWDFIVNTNYTTRYRSFGLTTDMSYQFNTTNSRDYRYGNRLDGGITAFLWKELDNITLLPQAGLRGLHSGIDYSSYTYRIKNTYSGGYQLYAAAGVGTYYRSLAVTGQVHFPVSSHYASGLVQPGTKYELQLQYLF